LEQPLSIHFDITTEHAEFIEAEIKSAFNEENIDVAAINKPAK
jgi:hypothetical protein